MRLGFALWMGVISWTAASWICLAVEGPEHQLTAWNWLVLAVAFVVGFVASLAWTEAA